MEYVIYYPQAKKYLRLDGKVKAIWEDDLRQAHRFSDSQKVNNFMRSNFKSAVAGLVNREDVEIMSFEVAAQRSDMPTLEPQHNEATLTEAEATQYLDALPEMMAQMYQTGNIMRALMGYYAEQISVADKAQEDLLHKVEFSHANVVDGYRIYKDLQTVRQRRRQCKDICDMLGTVHKSGTISSLINLQNAMKRYQEHIENRTYTPRVLLDLFTTISSANISAVLGGVQTIESEDVINEFA